MITDNRTAQSVQLLARSAFVLAASITLSALICLPLFVLSQLASAIQTNRAVVIGAALIILIGLLAVCIYLWRTRPERLIKPIRRLVHILQRRSVALLLTIIFAESTLLLASIQQRSASPAVWLVLWWAVISCNVLVILLIVHWRALRLLVERSRSLWISSGLTFMMIIGLVTLSFVNIRLGDVLVNASIPSSSPLWIFGPGHESEAAAYWMDENSSRLQWTPYVYWRRIPISGNDVTVGADGLRKTASFVNANTPGAQKIFFFGGSTVWGTGARDDHTIPSDVARILNTHSTPAVVTNFGESGYVSTQDMILFQMQLARGNVPNVAVFYEGYNDIGSAWQQKVAGIPQNEFNRSKDFALGRIIASDDIFEVASAVYAKGPPVNAPLIASSDDVPSIADRFLANVRLIRATAAAYNVNVIVIWQPILFFKQSRSDWENTVYQFTQKQDPGLDTLCRQVDTELRRRVEEGTGQGIVLLSDIFQNDTRNLYIDDIHITEEGNLTIAEKIAPFLSSRVNL